MYRQTGKPGQVRGGRPFISGPESRPFEISIGGREKDSTSNPLVISREIRASRPVRHVKAGVTLLHGRVNNLALPTPRVCTSRSPLDPRLRAPRIDLSKYPTYPLNRAGINPRVTTLLRRK